MKPKTELLALATAAMLLAGPALGAPQSFVSKAEKGSMDEFSRIALTRDCANLDDAPYIKCSRQEIVVRGKTGQVEGTFPASELPKLKDGTHKLNLTWVMVVDEDLGGGDGMRYFYLRFVPQDNTDMDVLPSGQMFPKYHEVVTDLRLRPLKGMRLSPNGAAGKWLDAKRKQSAKKVKAQEIETELRVGDYLMVMQDR